jgi:hypothetical protein
MPLYHVNIYNQTGETRDEEGQEFATLDDAVRSAIAGVRGVLAEELRGGALDLRGRIEIADGTGKILRTVPFREIVEVLLEPDAG